MNPNYRPSFSIKFDKSTFNKEKEKIGKTKNFKKTLTKNMSHKFNNISNQ